MLMYKYMYIYMYITYGPEGWLYFKNISRQNEKCHISYHNNIMCLNIQIKIPNSLVDEKLQGKRKLIANGTGDGIMGTK